MFSLTCVCSFPDYHYDIPLSGPPASSPHRTALPCHAVRPSVRPSVRSMSVSLLCPPGTFCPTHSRHLDCLLLLFSFTFFFFLFIAPRKSATATPPHTHTQLKHNTYTYPFLTSETFILLLLFLAFQALEKGCPRTPFASRSVVP